ncbi:hypothetical protein C9374_004849 [Naegleria lovaniensis]|uniref:Uncharacterized protein n=1 Tax=Naegleria lovaniensis TaxID=51637 RepID=A0AA88GRA6_NAELO|nr:uncharacterized protein C9374_004849 [Naegleria lovaniensis]KAG2382882.1 hypothetical protein C9374_004849 [Naegleria lovaniensis]
MFLRTSSPLMEEKIVAKVFFYAKQKKQQNSGVSASVEAPGNLFRLEEQHQPLNSSMESTKKKSYDEIRKIVLPGSFVEFNNQVMLSLSRDSNVCGSNRCSNNMDDQDCSSSASKQYLSDHTPMSIINSSKKNFGVTFKYQSGDEWINFASEDEYQKALLVAKQQKSLRVKVYYKKHLFKSAAHRASRHEKIQKQQQPVNHTFTISVDFQDLQKLLRESAQSDETINAHSTGSASENMFAFWDNAESASVEIQA